MDELDPNHDTADIRPLVYLIATVLLMAMIAVTGLLLQAELHKQAKNETQAPLQAMERPSQPAKGPFQFRGFHSAKVQP